MLFLNSLPIKNIVYLNVSQREDLTFLSHIHTEEQKNIMCQGTDILLKMLPRARNLPSLSQEDSGDETSANSRRASYSPFCVANGSRM